MNYNTLSIKDTDIWICNLQKVISLATTLHDYEIERMKTMTEQYKKIYCNGWRKFFYDDDFWLSYNGYAKPMGSFLKCKDVTPYSYSELKNKYHVYDYDAEFKNNFQKTLERWNKYAHKPFQIHESDVIFYQNMKDFHEISLNMAFKLGIEYEAYYLDEDCKNNC